MNFPDSKPFLITPTKGSRRNRKILTRFADEKTMDGINSVFGVKPQLQNGTNGAATPVILPFPKEQSNKDGEPLSKWQNLAIKTGAVMTASKSTTTDNSIKINPTVIALLISLFGVLAILVPVFIQFGRLSEKIELNEKKMERLELEMQNEKNERIRLDGKISYMLGTADSHGNEKKDKK